VGLVGLFIIVNSRLFIPLRFLLFKKGADRGEFSLHGRRCDLFDTIGLRVLNLIIVYLHFVLPFIRGIVLFFSFSIVKLFLWTPSLQVLIVNGRGGVREAASRRGRLVITSSLLNRLVIAILLLNWLAIANIISRWCLVIANLHFH
jgi:hypothetical protein